MSPTKDDKTKQEEPKGTLPPGDPEASYVEPDLSFQDGAGALPDNEQEWHDGRDEARAAAAEAAAENEDAVVKQRAEDAEKERAAREATQEAQTPSKATTTKASSSTSGSSS